MCMGPFCPPSLAIAQVNVDHLAVPQSHHSLPLVSSGDVAGDVALPSITLDILMNGDGKDCPKILCLHSLITRASE